MGSNTTFLTHWLRTLCSRITTVNGGQQKIHFSHFVRAPGAALPMRLRMINGGWDDSRLRRCLEDVKDAVAAKGGFLR